MSEQVNNLLTFFYALKKMKIIVIFCAKILVYQKNVLSL